jgi:hypothetical protein
MDVNKAWGDQQARGIDRLGSFSSGAALQHRRDTTVVNDHVGYSRWATRAVNDVASRDEQIVSHQRIFL